MLMFVLAFFILVSAPTFLFALDQIRRGVFFILSGSIARRRATASSKSLTSSRALSSARSDGHMAR